MTVTPVQRAAWAHGFYLIAIVSHPDAGEMTVIEGRPHVRAKCPGLKPYLDLLNHLFRGEIADINRGILPSDNPH